MLYMFIQKLLILVPACIAGILNPKRNMRGPRKTLTSAGIVIIVIREPMFHLILHNIKHLCWIE